MKHSGFLLLDVLCAVALVGALLTMAVLQVGRGSERLQQQQLDLAARRFLMEARRAQQQNMYAQNGDRVKVNVIKGNAFYTISTGGKSKKYAFEDEGCGDIVFDTTAEIYFSQLGSVAKSAYIKMKHKENENLSVTLNLQPVTGRLELEP